MTAGDVDRENYETGEVIPGLWRSTVSSMVPLTNLGSRNYTKEAESIRSTYAEYFCRDGVVPWQWKRIGVNDDYIYNSEEQEEDVDNDLEEVNLT